MGGEEGRRSRRGEVTVRNSRSKENPGVRVAWQAAVPTATGSLQGLRIVGCVNINYSGLCYYNEFIYDL